MTECTEETAAGGGGGGAVTRLLDFNWVYFTESKKTRISCGHIIYICVCACTCGLVKC